MFDGGRYATAERAARGLVDLEMRAATDTL
jgi:hypothetical protein